ncbi:MAG TPA: hypothetical protein VIG24_10445 [Acidimicrobiia bacterium]
MPKSPSAVTPPAPAPIGIVRPNSPPIASLTDAVIFAACSRTGTKATSPVPINAAMSADAMIDRATRRAHAVALLLTEVALVAVSDQWRSPQRPIREAIQWALRRRTVCDPGREALEHVAATLGITRPSVQGQPHHQAPSRLAERIAGIAETGSPEPRG